MRNRGTIQKYSIGNPKKLFAFDIEINRISQVPKSPFTQLSHKIGRIGKGRADYV